MIVLVLVLLILELILLLLRRIWVVHEISTALLVRLVLSTKIILRLVWEDRLRKGGRGGRVDSMVRGVMFLLTLKGEVKSQAVVVWLHPDFSRTQRGVVRTQIVDGECGNCLSCGSDLITSRSTTAQLRRVNVTITKDCEKVKGVSEGPPENSLALPSAQTW